MSRKHYGGILQRVCTEAVHPESVYVAPRFKGDSRATRGERPRPLRARDRLNVRLEILLELAEFKVALMKELLADKESIEDARRSGMTLPEGLL